MVSINKDEAKLIRKYFPYVHIRRTIHKYYMEENRKAMEFLKNCNAGKIQGVRSGGVGV